MWGAPLGKSGWRQLESGCGLQAGKMTQMAGGTTVRVCPAMFMRVIGGGRGLQADEARQDQRDEGRSLESSRHEDMLLLWRQSERQSYR